MSPIRAFMAAVLIAFTIGGCRESANDDSGALKTAADPVDGITPTEPSAVAPNPIATLPAGWVQFAVDEYSIWLPPRFVGGPLGAQRTATLDQIASHGGECDDFAGAFTNITENARLVAVDRDRCVAGAAAGSIINLILLKQPDQGFSVEQWVQAFVQQARPPLLAGESGTLAGRSRDIGRVINEDASTGMNVSVQYVMLSGGSAWLMNIAAGPELDSLLADFDRVALSLEDSLPDE